MNDEQLLRYSRQIMLPDIEIEGQEKLLAAKAIITELEVLALQQRKIQEQFRVLNSEQVKFNTLASRSRKQLNDVLQRADQKDQDMMNVMRFEALKR